MFTGLVQKCGAVAARVETPSGAHLTVEFGDWLDGASPAPTRGESIAVNGCCLTLVAIEDGRARFDVIHQTLRMTALGRLAIGSRVNLERAATPTTLLGGHLVQGHVDGVGRVAAVHRDGGEWTVRIEAPSEIVGLACPRGSIAVEGVSLTIADVADGTPSHAGSFDVCLIPETLARTTLGDLEPGSAVNLESDCVAKMVARAVRGSLAARQR